jgi:glycine dehydrogenase subunit 1
MFRNKIVYPYIPNSVPEVKKKMLNELGIDNSEDLFFEIPDHLKYVGRMNLPEPILDEFTLKKHIEFLLNKNKHCYEYLNFLGAGCAQHYVPAVCDSINQRGEFLTAYAADFYADHGKGQALFEFCSLMGELLEMDVVSGLIYDWTQAAATSLRMASRITGRQEVLLPKTMCPQTLMVVRNYMKGVSNKGISIKMVEYDKKTGLLDLDDLISKISSKTAAVFVENPSHLGFIETQARRIGEIAKENGAEFIVSTDPISLGVISPPALYGATIVCGDYHSLGIHMQCGGGQGGFIATHDDMKYVAEYKDKMYGLTKTIKNGEYGFGNVLFDRTSFGSREKAKEYTGTSSALWAISAAVYLALMGPQGMKEVSQTIMQKAQYCAKRLVKLDGVKLAFHGPFFKEFVINFDHTGRTVREINKSLLNFKIFGGKDISKEFPELGESSLYCVTEIITREDIDKLLHALKEIIRK